MASFMSLPAELRLKLYSHLMPGLGQYPSAYLGLRNSCRLIRAEYDHEAAKTIPHIYANAPLKLHTVDNVAWWCINHKPSLPKTIADLSAVTMQPTVFVVNRMARFPKKMILWHWTWLKTLVIEFDMSWGSRYTHYTNALLKFLKFN
jgi:hypothetical protein